VRDTTNVPLFTKIFPVNVFARLFRFSALPVFVKPAVPPRILSVSKSPNPAYYQ
jgi:hypothetical protein